jgi:hypothetical protein
LLGDKLEGIKMHTYGEIPDSIVTKRYIPLAKHAWKLHQKLGFDLLDKIILSSQEYLYPEIKERLDSTISTARAVIDETIKNPEKIVSYMLFPPVVTIRGDLAQGTNRLFYGESADFTFVVINEIKNEVFFMLNGHCEEGIPTDWWLAGPDDPLFERRHLKLGYKIRELPQKVKNLTDCGTRMIDILKDVRNERTPQWATSMYGTAMVYTMGMSNLLFERSSWEAYASIWDGISTKKLGLPDYWYCYVPWPPLIQTLSQLGRSPFTTRFCGLATGHQLYIQGLEKTAIDWLKTDFPDIWQTSIVNQFFEGIPLPEQTLGCQLPDLKDENIYKNSDFDWQYIKPENFLKITDLDLTFGDALQGVLTDITHESKAPFNASNVLSLGIGIKTQARKN